MGWILDATGVQGSWRSINESIVDADSLGMIRQNPLSVSLAFILWTWSSKALSYQIIHWLAAEHFQHLTINFDQLSQFIAALLIAITCLSYILL